MSASESSTQISWRASAGGLWWLLLCGGGLAADCGMAPRGQSDPGIVPNPCCSGLARRDSGRGQCSFLEPSLAVVRLRTASTMTLGCPPLGTPDLLQVVFFLNMVLPKSNFTTFLQLYISFIFGFSYFLIVSRFCLCPTSDVILCLTCSWEYRRLQSAPSCLDCCLRWWSY